jgi:hypothetical protein
MSFSDFQLYTKKISLQQEKIRNRSRGIGVIPMLKLTVRSFFSGVNRIHAPLWGEKRRSNGVHSPLGDHG